MLIIITVGTSLLENDGGKARKENSLVAFEGVKKKYAKKDYQYCASDANTLAQKLCQCLLKETDQEQPGALGYELRFRAKGNWEKADMLPQELSYLAILAGASGGQGILAMLEEGETADVALLASDSKRGRFTAEVLSLVLNRDDLCPQPKNLWKRFKVLDNIKEKIFSIGGLQTEDKERFEREGIPNLIDQVHKLCSREKYQKIFINFTGGFKGAIPYTTLAANFLPRDKDIRLHYLFHDTPHILELPLYPVGLDFTRWHSEAVMLDAARISSNKTYREQLTPPMANVAAQKDPPDHSLPALLEEQYREQLVKDPFQIYSKRVLEQFLGRDSSYYQNLAPLVERVGSLIWFGDKLPMAADHAANHHHHLLEIAQSLLTPIAGANIATDGQEQRPFLNEKEKYVLFAALLLHDCGHTLDVVKDKDGRRIPLLPSEVREYHHVLAWLRLGESREENGLDWAPREDLKEAVRLVCFYHRRRTGWTQTDSAKEFPYREDCRFPAPMENKTIKQTEGIDLRKLIALIRLIDGCDNQSRRVGGAVKTDLLEKILNEDAATRMVLLKRAAKATQSLYDGKQEDGKAEEGGEWLQRLCCWLETGTEDEQGVDALHKDAVKLSIALNLEGHLTPSQVFLLETIRLLDEWKLRHGQKPHLLKHEAVRRVRVLPATDFCVEGRHRWNFEVCLEPAPLFDAKTTYLVDSEEICHFAKQEGHENARLWIQSEVESELKENIDGKEQPVVLEYLQGQDVSGGKWGRITVVWDDERQDGIEKPVAETSSEN